jgi:very-short-patch-repair endonuclease
MVDFLAPAQRLVVLRRLGYRVLRLSAEMVLSAPEQALALIVALLK